MDFVRYLPLVFGGIFALALLLFGVVLIGVGLFALQRRGALTAWPQAAAQIEASEVLAERHFRDNDQGVLMYRPQVRYRYSAPGGDYRGDKLAVTGRLYAREGAARRVAGRYPAGGTAMVRYNPADPSEAYLEPEGWGGGLGFILFGVLCWIMPLLGAVKLGLSATTIAAALLVLTILPVLALRLGRNSSLAAARSRGLCPPAGSCSDADVVALATRGEKLLAIRLYRELHGCGLREARLGVDGLLRASRPQG